MNYQDDLRKSVRLLKASQNVSFKEFAGLLEMNTNSFYNWLCGACQLGRERQQVLEAIIDDLGGQDNES